MRLWVREGSIADPSFEQSWHLDEMIQPNQGAGDIHGGYVHYEESLASPNKKPVIQTSDVLEQSHVFCSRKESPVWKAGPEVSPGRDWAPNHGTLSNYETGAAHHEIYSIRSTMPRDGLMQHNPSYGGNDIFRIGLKWTQKAQISYRNKWAKPSRLLHLFQQDFTSKLVGDSNNQIKEEGKTWV